MAIVQNPITGRSSGSFAGAIFQTQFGKNILRSKPVLVRDAKSSEQLLQRSKFSVAVQWVSMFLSIIRSGFASLAVNKSAYSAAISWYLTNAVHWVTDHWEIDFAAAKLTFGDLLLPTYNAVAPLYSNASSTWNWTDNSGTGNALSDDELYIILYNKTKNEKFIEVGGRSDESIEFSLVSLGWEVGDIVKVYSYLKAANGILLSNTYYWGSVSITAA